MPCCCAFGCRNRNSDGKRLFALPSGERNAQRRKVWIQRIGRAYFEEVAKHARLCEDHFTEDQFEPQILQKSGIKKLKQDAVPNIFVHNKQPKLRKPPALCAVIQPTLHTLSGTYLQVQGTEGSKSDAHLSTETCHEPSCVTSSNGVATHDRNSSVQEEVPVCSPISEVPLNDTPSTSDGFPTDESNMPGSSWQNEKWKPV
ncbi:uncharacterized protein [Dermacentor andersoni]|uniref:uncharacterized protein n=1 Tax=Dermacentor andersoni TaxID=34620 RepID=UPI002155EBBE|nr:THAP domain-containing protein 1-like [Dermacentor andersoni]